MPRELQHVGVMSRLLIATEVEQETQCERGQLQSRPNPLTPRSDPARPESEQRRGRRLPLRARNCVWSGPPPAPNRAFPKIRSQVGTAWSATTRRRSGSSSSTNGDGVEPFPKVQIDSLVALLCDIGARRSLTASDIKGHQDLDTAMMTCGGKQTRRRVDPNGLYPWQDVLERVEQ
jgi:hypothetical protein